MWYPYASEIHFLISVLLVHRMFSHFVHWQRIGLAKYLYNVLWKSLIGRCWYYSKCLQCIEASWTRHRRRYASVTDVTLRDAAQSLGGSKLSLPFCQIPGICYVGVYDVICWDSFCLEDSAESVSFPARWVSHSPDARVDLRRTLRGFHFPPRQLLVNE